MFCLTPSRSEVRLRASLSTWIRWFSMAETTQTFTDPQDLIQQICLLLMQGYYDCRNLAWMLSEYKNTGSSTQVSTSFELIELEHWRNIVSYQQILFLMQSNTNVLQFALNCGYSGLFAQGYYYTQRLLKENSKVVFTCQNRDHVQLHVWVQLPQPLALHTQIVSQVMCHVSILYVCVCAHQLTCSLEHSSMLSQ